MSYTPCVLLLGTCDTKLEELLFLRDEIKRNNVEVVLMDVGRSNTEHEGIDISQVLLLINSGYSKDVSGLPRGEVIKTMAGCATAAVKELFDGKKIHGIINAGGSGGTSLAAEVMRNALPIGFPKLIVSTVASGDTGPIVGETDISMMYSVVDVAGLNQVLRIILSNAGAAIAGMSRALLFREGQDRKGAKEGGKKSVGITMFGVTTPAVDTIRKYLEAEYEIETFVFHATGHGGRAMERLIEEGALDAVLDLTTTEICDHVTGGVMSAGEHRLEAAACAGIPNIISVGATDMTNFGPIATVPERYKARRLYEHNPVVTLMRTSLTEAQQVGSFVAEKLKKFAKHKDMVEVWLPKGGVSMISTPGAPFEDREADQKMFGAIREGLDGSGIDVVDREEAVNDKEFAIGIAEALVRKMDSSKERLRLRNPRKIEPAGGHFLS
jgi:uncharacterized protein (UPF0261 family)